MRLNGLARTINQGHPTFEGKGVLRIVCYNGINTTVPAWIPCGELLREAGRESGSKTVATGRKSGGETGGKSWLENEGGVLRETRGTPWSCCVG